MAKNSGIFRIFVFYRFLSMATAPNQLHSYAYLNHGKSIPEEINFATVQVTKIPI